MEFRPLTPSRWKDLEALFGERGACGGCWCMYWRLSKKDWLAGKPEGGRGNKKAFKKLVEAGEPTGLLAYEGKQPVGWCAVAPREVYPGLARARKLKPIDDSPAWAITCFFVDRRHRGKGVSVALIEAAKVFVRKKGGALVEGYPCEPGHGTPDVFYWTGVRPAFQKAGFELASRRGYRSIMRCAL